MMIATVLFFGVFAMLAYGIVAGAADHHDEPMHQQERAPDALKHGTSDPSEG